MEKKKAGSSSESTIIQNIQRYTVSCFLLTLPVLIWDFSLTDSLPAVFQPDTFWKEIPAAIGYGEHISRMLLFACLLLMPLTVKTDIQEWGVLIYIVGMALYYSSWLALICFPERAWSNSLAGIMAPAYTPVCWLTGIMLIGKSFYFQFPYARFVFAGISISFLLFHNAHTYLVYLRNIAHIIP